MVRARSSALATLIGILLSPTAEACSVWIDHNRPAKGWTAEIDSAEAIFSGKLVSLRSPDRREMKELRARWSDSSPVRRNASDDKVVEAYADTLRIADFAVEHVARGDASDAVSIWFESSPSLCHGPYNDGLPVEIGQTVVVFATRTSDGLMGWIPDIGAVDQFGDPDLIKTIEVLYAEFEPCNSPLSGGRWIYIRTPKSGFGRGCLAPIDSTLATPVETLNTDHLISPFLETPPHDEEPPDISETDE